MDNLAHRQVRIVPVIVDESLVDVVLWSLDYTFFFVCPLAFVGARGVDGRKLYVLRMRFVPCCDISGTCFVL